MRKEFGFTIFALFVAFVLIHPPQAKAADVHFGISVGPAYPAYPYPTPDYMYPYPYEYDYPYSNYSLAPWQYPSPTYLYPDGIFPDGHRFRGDEHGGREQFRGHESGGHEGGHGGHR